MTWKTWIEIEPEESTNSEIQPLYRRTRNSYSNQIPDTVKLTSLTPVVSGCLFDLDRAIESAGTGITVREREIAALIVSIINGCVHCTASHTNKLEKISRSPLLGKQILEDYRTAELSPRELCIAEFAEKVTKYPNSCVRGDIELLHQNGLSDKEILNIVEIIAYYNFSSRLFESLSTIE